MVWTNLFSLYLVLYSLPVGHPSPLPISYQFPKPITPNTQAELQEIDDQIRELEDMKRGFLAKMLRHQDQAERLQFRERYYLEARRHMELAEENRQAAEQIQVEIDRLKQRRRQILEKNGAGDGFEDL
jgi:hypothetical protein